MRSLLIHRCSRLRKSLTQAYSHTPLIKACQCRSPLRKDMRHSRVDR